MPHPVSCADGGSHELSDAQRGELARRDALEALQMADDALYRVGLGPLTDAARADLMAALDHLANVQTSLEKLPETAQGA